jgi:hypothetical protein
VEVPRNLGINENIPPEGTDDISGSIYRSAALEIRVPNAGVPYVLDIAGKSEEKV